VIKNKNKQKWEEENVETVVVNNLNGILCQLQKNFGMMSKVIIEMTGHLEIVFVDIIIIVINKNKIVMLSVYLIILFEYIS
jgi:hypothetical protein